MNGYIICESVGDNKRRVLVAGGRCIKRAYKSKAKAKKAVRLQPSFFNGKQPYYCSHCGQWHLTSTRQRC